MPNMHDHRGRRFLGGNDKTLAGKPLGGAAAGSLSSSRLIYDSLIAKVRQGMDAANTAEHSGAGDACLDSRNKVSGIVYQ
jgi:hypothetical protein